MAWDEGAVEAVGHALGQRHAGHGHGAHRLGVVHPGQLGIFLEKLDGR